MKNKHISRSRGRNRVFSGRVESLEARTLLNASIDVDAMGLLTYQTDLAAPSAVRISEVGGVYTFAVGATDAPIDVTSNAAGLTIAGEGTRSVAVAGPSALEINAKADSDSILLASSKVPATIAIQTSDVLVTVGDQYDLRGLTALPAAVVVTGSSQYSNNSLTIDDRGGQASSSSTVPDTYHLTLTDHSVSSRSGVGMFSYSGVSALTVYGSPYGGIRESTVLVASTADGVKTTLDLSTSTNTKDVEIKSTSADPDSLLTIVGPQRYTRTNITIDSSSSPVVYQNPVGTDQSDVVVNVSVAGMTASTAISIAPNDGEGVLGFDAGGLPVTSANFQADGSGNVVFRAPAPQLGTVTFSGLRQVNVHNVGIPAVTFDSNTLTAADPRPVDYFLRSISLAPGTTIANYIFARVHWGDGTVSAGVLVAAPNDPSRLDVMGSHAYTQSGWFNISVDYLEYTPNGYLELWSGQGEAIAIASPAAVVVASFTPSPGATTSAYYARILWGDDTSTAGVVVADPDDPSRFNVTGSHIYAQAGSYVTGVTLIAHVPPQTFTVGGETIGIDSIASFNGNSFVIQGAINPDYGTSGGGPPGSHPGIPPSQPWTPDESLFEGYVNAASPRIDVYAMPVGGGSPILWGYGTRGYDYRSPVTGYWEFSPDSDMRLPDGVYTIQVRAFDDADNRATALTTIATGYVVGTPPSSPVSLVIEGSINLSYGPFPPPPPEPLPPGVTRDPTALISGTLNAASPRIDIYATPAGGGARLLFGHGSINESITYPTSQEAYWYFSPVTSPIPDGVYTIQAQAFDDVNHLTSALITIATGFVVGTPAPVVESNPLNATAGAPLTDVVVATFIAAAGASTASSPLILWGDNGWSEGRVVVDPADPTRYEVLGSHTYAKSGSYTPGVIVQPGADWTANGYSGNAVGIAGGFGDDQIQSTGVTNQTEPLLIGRTTAAPGAARIVAYATNDGGGSILIGQGVSGPSGYWQIQPDVPLPDGRYSIQVQAINDADHVGSAVTTIATGLVVDTVGPQIVGVQLSPGRGQVVVSYRDSGGVDDAGTGLDFGSVTSTDSYTFSQSSGPVRSSLPPAPWTVTKVVATPPFRTAPQRVTVVINGGRPIRGGNYQFTVLALQGVGDRAGNPLQGGFDGRFPTRGAGDFNARFNVVRGRALRPQAVRPPLLARHRSQAVLTSQAGSMR